MKPIEDVVLDLLAHALARVSRADVRLDVRDQPTRLANRAYCTGVAYAVSELLPIVDVTAVGRDGTTIADRMATLTGLI